MFDYFWWFLKIHEEANESTSRYDQKMAGFGRMGRHGNIRIL
jgi:hypothetical protein